MRNLKHIVSYLAVIIFYLILAQGASAADFAFDYLVSYDVLGNGSTSVRQKVTVTNLTSTLYAQNYTLSIASEKITDVRAKDTQGIITPLIAQAQGQTVITIPFNVVSAGIDKQFDFEISYVNGDIAKKIGRVWEIIIPGLEDSEDVQSYTITLNTPSDFPQAAYFSPLPKTPGRWTLSEHQGKGVTAAYGDYQRFDFNLNYHLENTSSNLQLQEITLPANTAFQKIIISNITSPPKNVIIDPDGNWIAKYELDRESTLDIKVDGTALVSVIPNEKAIVELTDVEREIYTKPQNFWQQNEIIKNIVKDRKTPRQIYDYVVDTLDYSYERVTPGIKRLGAEYALANPKEAVCMEFSDLFVAMARAAGIPAREIHGFAYTTNSRLQPLSLLTDVLHAWPEYYDSERKLWIPVDPTWGDTTRGVDYFTKLDFNHVAFAILGTESDYPYPAGAFRKSSSNKDVFVDFSTEPVALDKPSYKVTLSKNDFVSGSSDLVKVRISNTGNSLFQPQSLIVANQILKLNSQNSYPPIPPYGFIEFDADIVYPHEFLKKSETVSITLDGNEFKQTLNFSPFYTPYIGWILVLAASGILLVYVRKIIRKG